MFLLLVLACKTEAPPPEPVEEPPVAAEAVPEQPVAPTVITRSDCTFVDEQNRVEDANGRVAVNCAGELFQAKATYVSGGSYNFEVEAPAAVAAAPAATPAAAPVSTH